MKKIKLFFIPVFLFVISTLSADTSVPALTGRVVDSAGILSPQDEKTINNALIQFEKGTHGQMAILTVKSLNGQPIEEFGIKVADSWKIGYKDKDNGLILIISEKDRKIRLEVGSGWEGQINDARAGDIIRGMSSFFRKKQYKNGILFAVAASYKFITGKKLGKFADITPPQHKKKNNSGAPYLFILMFFLFFLMLGTAVTFGGNGRRRGIFVFSGGGFSDGGGLSGGGGFSGGGGGFSGGGASGSW